MNIKQQFLVLALLISIPQTSKPAFIKGTCLGITILAACRATWVVARGMTTQESDAVPVSFKIGTFEIDGNVGKNWLHSFDRGVVEAWKTAREKWNNK